jgi:hypothetical protein
LRAAGKCSSSLHRPRPAIALNVVGNGLYRERQLFRQESWYFKLDSIRYKNNTMQFSADAFAKHGSGIQNRSACAGNQERDCRVNDKGIRNAFGVWFVPGQGGRNNPPADFWSMKCAPRGGGDSLQWCNGKLQ